MKNNIVFGFLGLYLLRDKKQDISDDRRPTVAMFKNTDFIIHEFHLIHPSSAPDVNIDMMLSEIFSDIHSVSPQTYLESHIIDFESPWNFLEVYRKLLELYKYFPFSTDKANYYFHITVGNHVQQICAYLLVESRRFPGKLLQTYSMSPYRKVRKTGYAVLDPRTLPVSIREQQNKEKPDNTTILKSGFKSINLIYNDLIEDLRLAAENSKMPILILGETGTGKSVEARRIYEVKRNVFGLKGQFIEINCATLTRELAVATLFGYKKGDYSGANHDQPGVLQQSNGGGLFLDEIGELTLDVQAMLLQAIDTKRYKIFGIHEEIKVDFQLICGTNKNLDTEVKQGKFREDLLARINFWTFTLPVLRNRMDDIPNLITYFMDGWSDTNSGLITTFERKALEYWLDFTMNPRAVWSKNLRELKHSIEKMCYFAMSNNNIISKKIVEKETGVLKRSWENTALQQELPAAVPAENPQQEEKGKEIPHELITCLHHADHLMLKEAIKIAAGGGTLKEIGELLFSIPDDNHTKNYSDLARKFLDRCTAKRQGYRFEITRGKGLVLTKKQIEQKPTGILKT